MQTSPDCDVFHFQNSWSQSKQHLRQVHPEFERIRLEVKVSEVDILLKFAPVAQEEWYLYRIVHIFWQKYLHSTWSHVGPCYNFLLFFGNTRFQTIQLTNHMGNFTNTRGRVPYKTSGGNELFSVHGLYIWGHICLLYPCYQIHIHRVSWMCFLTTLSSFSINLVFHQFPSSFTRTIFGCRKMLIHWGWKRMNLQCHGFNLAYCFLSFVSCYGICSSS